jgi:hypothetical protein
MNLLMKVTDSGKKKKLNFVLYANNSFITLTEE